MKFDFRVDWGYQYLYSRRHYHPTYIWDGEITLDKGKVEELYKLSYPYVWFGIPHTPTETKIDGTKWQDRTKRGFSGIHIIADVKENSVITIKTTSKTVTFSVKELTEKGRIVYKVGPKYLNCNIIVTKTGYYWAKAEPKEGETVFAYDKLSLPYHNYTRENLAWLAPGERAKWEADLHATGKDYTETLFHTMAMVVPEFEENTVLPLKAKEMKLALYCDGEKVKEYKRYYKHHDKIQFLEDDWVRVKLPDGKHKFELENLDDELSLAFRSISLKQCGYDHGELSIPSWGLKNERLVGRVFATHDDTITVECNTDKISLNCKFGWNEFEVKKADAGKYIYKTTRSTATFEIFDTDIEEDPVKVGYGTTFIPLDDNGFMDWMLDYTARTRLGNYIHEIKFENLPISRESKRRMGEFCKNHGLYLSCAKNYMDGGFAEGAGEIFHDCGPHELPGKVYAFDPTPGYSSKDMKEASEHFVDFLKTEIDNAHKVCKTAAYGDSSGGIRYSYLAGADFVRAETMVPHTQTILSQARPATEALGDGKWGVHIATQHAYFPYFREHLCQCFISMAQPWIMGAEVIYEEDSANVLFKEERQCWDDALVKGKRELIRNFYKFVKTHPRHGKNVRNIAFYEGRYAAPFNGFICDTEQDPHYSVWGMFGNDAPEWGHGQPEKSRQILDVLMPGAATLPLRQKFDKRRFFFSGTPYGDFDCIPAEASADYYKNYKLLLNLGWNTMIEEDYEKLKDYVKDGGTLLTGIPQFSTHTGREFLKDMEDLSLWNDGDLSELCGIKVKGKGEKFSGQWNCEDRANMPEPNLSAMPSDSAEEDGEGYACDFDNISAEVVAWDMNGAPLLVKHNYGKGTVYTLTIWAYPGHEKFQNFSASIVSKLAGEATPKVRITDNSGEIFWTVWQDNDTTQIYVLNTDWTEKGNTKTATLITPTDKVNVQVKEGSIVILALKNQTLTKTESFDIDY